MPTDTTVFRRNSLDLELLLNIIMWAEIHKVKNIRTLFKIVRHNFLL